MCGYVSGTGRGADLARCAWSVPGSCPPTPPRAPARCNGQEPTVAGAAGSGTRSCAHAQTSPPAPGDTGRPHAPSRGADRARRRRRAGRTVRLDDLGVRQDIHGVDFRQDLRRPEPHRLVPHAADGPQRQPRHGRDAGARRPFLHRVPPERREGRRRLHRERGRRDDLGQQLPALGAARDDRQQARELDQHPRHPHPDGAPGRDRPPQGQAGRRHRADPRRQRRRPRGPARRQQADRAVQRRQDRRHAGSPLHARHTTAPPRAAGSGSTTTARRSSTSPRRAPAGTSSPAATCSPTRARATRRAPSPSSSSTGWPSNTPHDQDASRARIRSRAVLLSAIGSSRPARPSPDGGMLL